MYFLFKEPKMIDCFIEEKSITTKIIIQIYILNNLIYLSNSSKLSYNSISKFNCRRWYKYYTNSFS